MQSIAYIDFVRVLMTPAIQHTTFNHSALKLPTHQRWHPAQLAPLHIATRLAQLRHSANHCAENPPASKPHGQRCNQSPSVVVSALVHNAEPKQVGRTWPSQLALVLATGSTALSTPSRALKPQQVTLQSGLERDALRQADRRLHSIHQSRRIGSKNPDRVTGTPAEFTCTRWSAHHSACKGSATAPARKSA